MNAFSAHSLLERLTAGDYRRLLEASHDPFAFQWRYLSGLIRENRSTAFGRDHGFADLGTVAAYQDRVPISDYDDLEPYIGRVAKGERGVLTAGRVLAFVPTSGTTGANKFIPYTRGLIAGFNRALNAWVHALYREEPDLKWGRSFWLLSPSTPPPALETKVPVGFVDDRSYFGLMGKWLVGPTMALPPGLPALSNEEAHFFGLCLFMLKARDLRLISVWNPTLLPLILQRMMVHRDGLLASLRTGRMRWPSDPGPGGRAWESGFRDPGRADELTFLLRGLNAEDIDWHRVWPNLRLISCWADGWAAMHIPALVRLFPQGVIQPKGLLATEAVVTIPLKGMHLPAIGSHFFEFRETETGRVCLTHQLEAERTYEVLVTNGGGLYRYRMYDLVRVRGFWNALPDLEFLGRSSRFCDLTGEKLSEPVVAQALARLGASGLQAGQDLFLSPCSTADGHFYVLYCSQPEVGWEAWPEVLDEELKKGYYYLESRRNGQLLAPRLFQLSQADRLFLRDNPNSGGPAGVKKTRALDGRLNLFRELSGEFYPKWEGIQDEKS